MAASSDNYYKLDDVEIEKAMFSQDNVDNFLLYRKSIELIGIVEKPEMKNNLIKFNFVNKSGLIIQVMIWDESVRQKMKSLILPGNILHFDGLFVNKHHTMSSGNINFDLVVSTNSHCHLIKAAPMYVSENNDNIIATNIEDSVKHNGTIEVTAWLKQKISQVSVGSTTINKGCLSDCAKYKLEVRISSMCDMSDLLPGAHVKVTGVIKYAAHPYILVNNKDDIKIVSPDVKSLKEYLKGASIPKRPLAEQNNNSMKKLNNGT